MTVAILVRCPQVRPGTRGDDALGPCERAALIAGLRLAEQLGSSTVALSVGAPRRDDPALIAAARMGVRGLKLEVEGADDLDYLGVASLLAAALRTLTARWVVCGDRSLDERLGAIGPAVAHVLDFAHVTGVTSTRGDGDVVVCERLTERQHQVLAVRAPAVLCLRPNTAELDGEDVEATAGIEPCELDKGAIDLRYLATRRAMAGGLRSARTPRRATVLDGPAALVARLRADRLILAAATPGTTEREDLP